MGKGSDSHLKATFHLTSNVADSIKAKQDVQIDIFDPDFYHHAVSYKLVMFQDMVGKGEFVQLGKLEYLETLACLEMTLMKMYLFYFGAPVDYKSPLKHKKNYYVNFKLN